MRLIIIIVVFIMVSCDNKTKSGPFANGNVWELRANGSSYVFISNDTMILYNMQLDSFNNIIAVRDVRQKMKIRTESDAMIATDLNNPKDTAKAPFKIENFNGKSILTINNGDQIYFLRSKEMKGYPNLDLKEKVLSLAVQDIHLGDTIRMSNFKLFHSDVDSSVGAEVNTYQNIQNPTQLVKTINNVIVEIQLYPATDDYINVLKRQWKEITKSEMQNVGQDDWSGIDVINNTWCGLIIMKSKNNWVVYNAPKTYWKLVAQLNQSLGRE